jgi:hypothetical protein
MHNEKPHNCQIRNIGVKEKDAKGMTYGMQETED